MRFGFRGFFALALVLGVALGEPEAVAVGAATVAFALDIANATERARRSAG